MEFKATVALCMFTGAGNVAWVDFSTNDERYQPDHYTLGCIDTELLRRLKAESEDPFGMYKIQGVLTLDDFGDADVVLHYVKRVKVLNVIEEKG